jgi:hypothetical protein
VATGLGLLVWPLASFIGFFIFDAPVRGEWDELWRYSIVLPVWSYPALWGVGLAWLRRLAARGECGVHLLVPCLLPLVPLLWVTVNFLAMED